MPAAAYIRAKPCKKYHFAPKKRKKEREMSSKLVTVFGATGLQGGTVVNALLSNGGFNIRAITRNPESDKAKALKAKGVTIMKASLDDPASIAEAVNGSHCVFLVTNYWEYQNKEREIKQGKAAADACKKAGVTHLVYSGIELVKEITGRDCPHFDGKGEVEKYIDSIGLPNTSIRVSYYYENFISFRQKNEDGSYTITFPMNGPMDAVSVHDIGPMVATILSKPDEYIGKKVGVTGDRMSLEEYCEIITKITGITMTYNKMANEDYAQLFKGSDDLAAMFHFYEFGNPDRNLSLTKTLNPNTKSFTEWVTENKASF